MDLDLPARTIGRFRGICIASAALSPPMPSNSRLGLHNEGRCASLPARRFGTLEVRSGIAGLVWLLREVTVSGCHDWCILRIVPGFAEHVQARLSEFGLAWREVSLEADADARPGPARPGAAMLQGLIFVEYDDDLSARVKRIDGVEGFVQNASGRPHAIPAAYVDMLGRDGVNPLGFRFRSKLMAMSEEYRLDFLLSEIGHFRAREPQRWSDSKVCAGEGPEH